MRKRKRILGQGKGEFPLSSMIDIVFLLLIYFIVTQKPIIEETMLKVQLPDDIPGPPTMITPLKIDVFKEKGDFYRMNNRAYKKETLFKHLGDIAERDPEQLVIINCGGNAKHEKLVRLLDACAEVELSNLNIVNDESRPLEK